jgi:hypothetical protein
MNRRKLFDVGGRRIEGRGGLRGDLGQRDLGRLCQWAILGDVRRFVPISEERGGVLAMKQGVRDGSRIG